MKGPLPARRRRDPFLAPAVLSLSLITGCAGTGAARPRIETLPPQPPAPASSDAPAAPVTMIFRVTVAVDGQARSFSAGAIHLVRTDLAPSWHADRRVVRGDPRVRSLAPDAPGWYAVELYPGRYHLNVVDSCQATSSFTS